MRVLLDKTLRMLNGNVSYVLTDDAFAIALSFLARLDGLINVWVFAYLIDKEKRNIIVFNNQQQTIYFIKKKKNNIL